MSVQNTQHACMHQYTVSTSTHTNSVLVYTHKPRDPNRVLRGYSLNKGTRICGVTLHTCEYLLTHNVSSDYTLSMYS